MPKPLSAILVLGLFLGCKPQPDSSHLSRLKEQLAEAEAVDKNQAEGTRKLSHGLAEARQQVQHLETELHLAQEEFASAQRMYEYASARGTVAAEGFENARDAYQRASEKYRLLAAILILAAASDTLTTGLCDSTMSTRTFREQLRKEGVLIQEGTDVDHIWPRPLGGVYHPANYQLLPAEVNRRLGASVWEKFMTTPMATLQGLVTSALITLRCGR